MEVDLQHQHWGNLRVCYLLLEAVRPYWIMLRQGQVSSAPSSSHQWLPRPRWSPGSQCTPGLLLQFGWVSCRWQSRWGRCSMTSRLCISDVLIWPVRSSALFAPIALSLVCTQSLPPLKRSPPRHFHPPGRLLGIYYCYYLPDKLSLTQSGFHLAPLTGSCAGCSCCTTSFVRNHCSSGGCSADSRSWARHLGTFAICREESPRCCCCESWRVSFCSGDCRNSLCSAHANCCRCWRSIRFRIELLSMSCRRCRSLCGSCSCLRAGCSAGLGPRCASLLFCCALSWTNLEDGSCSGTAVEDSCGRFSSVDSVFCSAGSVWSRTSWLCRSRSKLLSWTPGNPAAFQWCLSTASGFPFRGQTLRGHLEQSKCLTFDFVVPWGQAYRCRDFSRQSRRPPHHRPCWWTFPWGHIHLMGKFR